METSIVTDSLLCFTVWQVINGFFKKFAPNFITKPNTKYYKFVFVIFNFQWEDDVIFDKCLKTVLTNQSICVTTKFKRCMLSIPHMKLPNGWAILASLTINLRNNSCSIVQKIMSLGPEL